MLVPFDIFPADIVEAYDLKRKVRNNKVLAKILMALYGLPQAGIIAYKELVKLLATGGYISVRYTPGLFKHDTRPTQVDSNTTTRVVSTGAPHTAVYSQHSQASSQTC